jgi:hypothetical protein
LRCRFKGRAGFAGRPLNPVGLADDSSFSPRGPNERSARNDEQGAEDDVAADELAPP